MTLSDYIRIRRRYTRSVQLERDLEIADSVKGYILTPNAKELVLRFFDALMQPDSVRAWTLTGVYGTGKSAFAHFLTALCSSKDDKINSNASAILGDSRGKVARAIKDVGNRGLIRVCRNSAEGTYFLYDSSSLNNWWCEILGGAARAASRCIN